MSFVTELRKQGARFSLIAGTVVLMLAAIFLACSSSWGYVFGAIGLLLFASGAKTYLASSAIDGVSQLLGIISRQAEPEWDGEIIYSDGGRHKIRYSVDSRNRPYFVASDICVAIGENPPHKNAVQWTGAPIFVWERRMCFSRESVQAYLSPLAVKNHEANRLLTLLRNEVFRKLNRHRE